MDGQEVRASKKIAATEVAGAGGAAPLLAEVLAPGDNVHPKGAADLGHAAAEPAQPEQGKRHAFKIEADGCLPRCSGLEAGVLVTDPAREVDHQAGGDGDSAVA